MASIFSKIVNGELPAYKVAESEDYDFKILDPVRYIEADDIMD